MNLLDKDRRCALAQGLGRRRGTGRHPTHRQAHELGQRIRPTRCRSTRSCRNATDALGARLTPTVATAISPRRIPSRSFPILLMSRSFNADDRLSREIHPPQRIAFSVGIWPFRNLPGPSHLRCFRKRNSKTQARSDRLPWRHGWAFGVAAGPATRITPTSRHIAIPIRQPDGALKIDSTFGLHPKLATVHRMMLADSRIASAIANDKTGAFPL